MRDPALKGRRVLVWGLGRFGGGVGVTRWLISQGAKVLVTDQAPAETLGDSIAALADLPVEFHLGGQRVEDWDEVDLIVVNPAVVKWKSDFFQEMQRRGLPWTTEINLFCARCPATVVGVTGSYGKSTTCAMLHEVLRYAAEKRSTRFRRVYLGGNIGRSLLPELHDMAAEDVVVLELSNAQLEDLPRIGWAPPYAIITNLYPHHLDRYRRPEEYFEAKANIVRDPAGQGPVIVGPLDPRAEAILLDVLADRPDRLIRVRPPVRPIKLMIPGAHNRDNGACVLEVVRILGIDEGLARETLHGFRGLPHRLEFVRSLHGVDYINDSKSTAPSATVKALEAFDRPVVLIVGGQKKNVPLDALREAVSKRCRAVIGMGESGADFKAALGTGLPDGALNFLGSVSAMTEAVDAARRAAQAGDIVLLSSGAPSFDAYNNYEERGRDFTNGVNNLSP